MKSLTIVSTWGPKYWPNPVQAGIQSTIKNWPGHAKILYYPDDMSQQIDLPRTQYFDLCKEQPVLKEFIERNKDNQNKTIEILNKPTENCGTTNDLRKSKKPKKTKGEQRKT